MASPISSFLIQPPLGLNAHSDETGVYLDWIHSQGAVSYEVYRDGKLLTTTENNFCDDYSIRDCYVHSYHIIAIDSAGSISVQSETVEVAVKELNAPHLSARLTENEVILSWYPVQGADGYRVYANNVQLDRADGLQYIDTLEASIGNCYYIIAYNDVGDSSRSNYILASEGWYDDLDYYDDISLDYYLYQINNGGEGSPSHIAEYTLIAIIMAVMLIGITILGISKSSFKNEEFEEENEDKIGYDESSESKDEIINPNYTLEKILIERRIHKEHKRSQEE